MPDLKIQDAKLLFKKIYSNPKNYNLKSNENGVSGGDDQVIFRFYKAGERVVFEAEIDGFTFSNSTAEWTNSMIMLENAIKKLEREEENKKVQQALDKLRKYLAED
ncbi:hypothetical protein BAX95_01065 [Elizabethkingia meningoseptica]|uniref:hypothetical protein n=1 Tax=Elizabethkingia meningoseptica TaxID=238 RepID=UPI0008412E3D|nr:hypothetical protein [Elizabethkingia meningoseptica]ODM54174.1 hypothetical protein BES09_08245 [Elizabethkingia meningoseptica]OHT29401.1 hypothetical protein BFF93_08255 [Elizabethkingia meningoseptica]OPC08552.1 hypothetical protein BAX93_13760 [Elizabethkingia meningoseptica]OPC25533.1 hypothetical protein BAX95_01065 [Elizabethkingia meningoseptica]